MCVGLKIITTVEEKLMDHKFEFIWLRLEKWKIYKLESVWLDIEIQIVMKLNFQST